MSEKTNTDLKDVLASLKSIITDESETVKEVAVSGVGGKLILAPSLRVADDASDDEGQRKEMLEEKISLREEMIIETNGLWEPDAARQDDNAGSPLTGVPTEEIADAAFGDMSFDISDVADENLLIKNDHEEVDRGEHDIEEASVPPWSVDYETLKPMVADIIRGELRGVLGEKITANIRSMVRREIEIAIGEISRDTSD